MAYEKLIELNRCRSDGGTFVEHNGHELAVFRLVKPDRLFVIDNACPHASGNLAGGEVNGTLVDCPWHHWKFDLVTGQCTDPSPACVNVYPTQVREGDILIDLADTDPHQ